MHQKQRPKRYFMIPVFGLGILFLCQAFPASAAITLDNTSSNGAFSNSGITSISWTHTVNSCTNCVVYVGISTYSQILIATPRVLNVTYGAQTMTSVGSQVSPAPTLPAVGNSAVELFSLVAPSTGASTVTVTFAIPVNYALGSALSFNGVNQGTPNSAFASASAESSSPGITISSTVAGDVALDVLASDPGAVFFAEDALQSVCTDTMDETTCTRGRRFFGNSFDVGAMSRKTATSSSTAMNWTLTTSASWAQGGVALKPFILTAADVSVSGRVLSSQGLGVRNAMILLTDQQGNTAWATTNPFGYFRVNGLNAGQSYIVKVSSKGYRFASRILTLSDDLAELVIVAESDAARPMIPISSRIESKIEP